MIYKHYKEHNTAVPNNFIACFNVIKKCMNKFDCPINEMLCIQELKPALNVQSDSLRAKIFPLFYANSVQLSLFKNRLCNLEGCKL